MKRYVVRLIIVSVVTFIFVSNALGLDAITYIYYPDNYAGTDNPISINFNGKVYTDSWWFSEVANGQFAAGPDEQFILKVDKVNREGTLDDVVALWAPDERDDSRQTFSDPIVFSGSQGYFHLVSDSAFLDKMAYGPYLIFLIQQTDPETGDQITEVPTILIDVLTISPTSSKTIHFTYI